VNIADQLLLKIINMLDIYQSAVIIAAFFFTGFGSFAVWKNQSDPQARHFALLALAYAVWIFSWFGLLKMESDMYMALFFARLLNLGATFIPVLFLHWVYKAVSVKKKYNIFLYFCYALTLFFASFSFSDLYISGVRSISVFPYWPVAGPLYIYFIVIGYVGFILSGLILLVYNYFRSSGQVRYRIACLFIGSMLSFVGGGVNFPMMLGYVIPQPFDLVGVFMLMTSPIIFSYAVLHYKLFEIRNVAIQLVAGALNIVFVINLTLAKTFGAIFVNSALFVFTVWFTVMLFRTLSREISQRERIELLASDLQAANDNQTNLIHVMNHQIKGKLTDAKAAFAELLTDDYGTVPDAAKVIVRQGFEQTQLGVDYVQGILKSLSAASGSLPYDMKEVDLKALVKKISDKLAEKAKEKKLAFEVNLVDGDFVVTADTMQLGEAIGNLISNSISYTPSGSIHIWLTKKGTNALIAVQDTGIGISDEDKTKLFKSGGRGKDSIRVNVNSTGYGLSFVKGVVEAHKGRVWAESDGPGKGSSFYMELPLG